MSLTDADLVVMGVSDPISRTKVLTALADVPSDQSHSGSMSSSSSSSSLFDLVSVRSYTKAAIRRNKLLRLKCLCEGEIRVLRFEDGPPLLASFVAKQAALLFGIQEAPPLDERHLRTLLRRNGKLQLFRPHTPRENK